VRYLLVALNVVCCETAKRPELGERNGHCARVANGRWILTQHRL